MDISLGLEEGRDERICSCSGSLGSDQSSRGFVALNNPFQRSCGSTDKNLSSEEELLILENSRLSLMEDEEGFSSNFTRPNVCRRCRSFSSSLPTTSPSASYIIHSSFGNRARHNTGVKQDAGDSTSQYLIDNKYPNGLMVEGQLLDDDEPLLGAEDFGDGGTDHCHAYQPSKEGVKQAKRQLILSSCLCLCFMLGELVGGYFANSLAIMTDAAHLLSDLASFLISIFALWVGQKPPTKRMSFGFYRAEILGAVLSVLVIWVLTGILVYLAIDRVRFEDYEIDADVMLIVSGCGVAMNIIMGLVLHGSCLSHSHSHGLNASETSNSQNINVRAAFIHVVGDLIQSIGVLIAAYIIHYKPEYKLADPICTFIFSVLVLFTTLTIMRDAVHVLMEGFPRELNYAVIKTDLQNIQGVKMAHSLHIWSLTIDKNALAVHLAIDPELDPHVVLRTAEYLVRQKYGIYHTTVQVEKYDPTTMLSCNACQGPRQ
ncbi:zinc transporter 2-like [Limulus polyphemus]|uniref:Zinc transporter 2-like n=1 Tax=Limulus polyphemus TaxID=6850 RepID=A0ABM1BL70_LIMPO|nr:zinc transporter 2-like [Limulus polyphemus]